MRITLTVLANYSRISCQLLQLLQSATPTTTCNGCHVLAALCHPATLNRVTAALRSSQAEQAAALGRPGLKPLPENLVGDCWPCIIEASLLDRLTHFQTWGVSSNFFQEARLDQPGLGIGPLSTGPSEQQCSTTSAPPQRRRP